MYLQRNYDCRFVLDMSQGGRCYVFYAGTLPYDQVTGIQ